MFSLMEIYVIIGTLIACVAFMLYVMHKDESLQRANAKRKSEKFDKLVERHCDIFEAGRELSQEYKCVSTRYMLVRLTVEMRMCEFRMNRIAKSQGF